MNKEKYIESQSDCAKLLGQSMFEYNRSLKKIKYPKFENSSSNEKKVKKLLSQLGLKEKDLKKSISR